MAKPEKKSFKLNVLGIFSIETEDVTFKQKLILMALTMLFVLIVIVLLKVYAIPTLGITGAISKWNGLVKMFKSRSP